MKEKFRTNSKEIIKRIALIFPKNEYIELEKYTNIEKGNGKKENKIKKKKGKKKK